MKETEDSLAHNFLDRRAGTNSFSINSLQEQKPPKEAKTNSFSSQSFRGILSLNPWWRIFLFCSFQLVCAALLLTNGSFEISFPTESLQQEELVTAYSRSSFQQESLLQEGACSRSLPEPDEGQTASAAQLEAPIASSRRSFTEAT